MKVFLFVYPSDVQQYPFEFVPAEAENVGRGTKIVIELNDNSKEFAMKETVESTFATIFFFQDCIDLICDTKKYLGIIKKYSNFVGFPIKLNDKEVNIIKPLWTLPKSEITEKQHKGAFKTNSYFSDFFLIWIFFFHKTEFYQFIAHAYDEPQYILHYTTDSPLTIRSLFYVGKQHGEKYGMGRLGERNSQFTSSRVLNRILIPIFVLIFFKNRSYLFGN